MGNPSQTRNAPRPRQLALAIKDHLTLLLSLLGCMWLLEIVDLLPLVDLDRHGIQPRSTSGLIGIVFAPLLHAGLGHLAVNSLPFLVLGGFVVLGGVRVFWAVTILITLLGGAGVWLFGGSFTNHLGASGLIFGYLGFILGRGLFEKSLLWIFIACITLFLYGGLLLGVLPTSGRISWEGHLFGFLAGVGSARLLSSKQRAMLR